MRTLILLVCALSAGCASPPAPRVFVASETEVFSVCGNPKGCVKIYYCEEQCDIIVSNEQYATERQKQQCNNMHLQKNYSSVVEGAKKQCSDSRRNRGQ